MGMSPSCHCICPGEPGIGSSGTIPTHHECAECDGAAPNKYELVVSDVTGTVSACVAAYNGTFILNHLAGCRWTTKEMGVTCVGDPAGQPYGAPRYILDVLEFQGGQYFRLTPSVGGYYCVGTTCETTPVSPLDCDLPYTLTSAYGLRYSMSFGCVFHDMIFSTKVTITPI